ncbi:hypothetical protein [Thiomicrospira sp. ALE5]|uniref:hypothetical protein n=1 Tax=Thiomicrospira sp. ALE5 TaxID=748650 RepID=UPI0008E70389|nr:hypothetical protein [Thiomicrospira sp. ALE5]SFR53525.1 hypothetical protein SAMN03092900_0874 [Thiomicrospira sp. ALE5]
MNYFALGWDVGGWNCDKNPSSRDALVLLDPQHQQVGQSWRGNLRELINVSNDYQAWLSQVASLLALPADFFEQHPYPVYLGIDTPLGVSVAWQELIIQFKPVAQIEDSASNPYLYRYTERWLLARGHTPLSAIKDMIGSQATKGRHLLAKVAPYQASCGIWQDATGTLSAFEVYPSLAKKSPSLQRAFSQISWQQACPEPGDVYDAAYCALVAACLASQPEQLAQPPKDTPWSEGWIFVPCDSINE